MRKIGAYFLGVFLLLLLGAALLHPSLLAVADWLGPLLGSSIYGAMTMAFLMVGDPLGYPVLFVIWFAVAMIVGALIRRRLGAVLIGVLVWLTMIPISASLILAIVEGIQETLQTNSGPLGGLPQIPRALNLATIFDAPIIGDVAKKALLAMSNEVGGQKLTEDILSSLLLGLLLKPLIMIVGALIGVELGRLIQKRSIDRHFSLLRFGKKTVATFFIIGVITTSFTPSVSAVQFTNNSYVEALVGTIDKNGRAYVGALFAQMGSDLSEMGVSASDADGLAAAIVVSQGGVVDEFGRKLSGSLGGVSSLLNLLPPTFAVVVYIDVSKDVASQRSISVSRTLSSTYGVDLSQLTSFNFKPAENDTEKMPMITISLFQSASEIDVLAANYLTKYSSHGGFVDALNAAVTNGRLIPDKVDGSASGSIFAAGFVNVDALKGYLPEEEVSFDMSQLFDSLGGSVDFAGSASFWSRGEQPSNSAIGIDILDLLGLSSTPNYSPNSDISVLLTLPPPSDDSSAPFKVNLSTNAQLSDDELDAIRSFFEKQKCTVHINQDALSASDLLIDTTDLKLPPNVVLTKTITGDTILMVNVIVANKDTELITEVTVDDSSSLNDYNVDLVSGNPKATWGTIYPGETRTLTYSIRVDQPGIYTFDSAIVSYTGGGETYRDASNSVETSPRRPFLLLLPFEIIAVTWMAGSQLFDMVTGRGVIIMSVVTLAFVLFIVWEGVKSYKRYRSAKDAIVVPQPEDGGTSAAPP